MYQEHFTHELKRLRIELEPNELVFEIIHKHWGKILWPFVSLGFFVLLSFVVSIFITASQGINQNLGIYFFIIGLWYFGLIGYGFSEWISYRQSSLIITNQRLIDCQQLNPFSRRVQTIDIHEIQSCSGELAPRWGIVFNYGNLWINTVGDRPISVGFIPLPEVVSGYVMHYHNLVAHGGVQAHGDQVAPSSQKQLEDLGNFSEKMTAIHQVEQHSQDSGAHAFNTAEASFQSDDEVLHGKQFELEAVAPNVVAPITLHSLYPDTKSTTKEYNPLDDIRIERKKLCLLMFHVPSEKLKDLLAILPAQKEPSIKYLSRTDYYEVETIVDPIKVSNVVKDLQDHGAEDIVCSQIELIV